MFKNYLKITLRNFMKYKAYTLLNVTGLVIGFTCAVLIFLYIRYELSYDEYHENADSIYRIVTKNSGDVWLGTDMWNATSGMLKTVIVDNLPGIKRSTRIRQHTGTVHHNENNYIENKFFLVDPEFLEIFSFPLVHGDPQSALSEPLNVLLTEEMAAKFFGNEYPVGKTLTIDNYDYKVSGILKSILPNSHFTFDILASFSTLYATPIEQENENIERWGWNNYSTYIQTEENIKPDELGNTITKLVKQKRDRNIEYHLQLVTDIHLHSHVNEEIETNSDIGYVYIFSAVAVFLLLIACFNYLNLSTAQAYHRAKEVGIRKVAGANRKQISFQFFSEALLISFIAFILSIILIKLILPSFNVFVERELRFNIINESGIIVLLIFITFLT
ncbi:MAG: FtsX-like permease family protein, partial [bacterium]|nr:FtsX-like permease family protein [bacterium]